MRPMRFCCSLLLPAMLFAQDSAIQTALSKPVLAAGQPLVEVQVYTASRVRSMPSVATREQWDEESRRIRSEVLERVVFRGEAQRWRDAKTRVEWQETLSGPGYQVKKLRYEAIPGLWVPALLYEPASPGGKVPVVLNVNGHERTGVSTPYIQERCINLAKRGMLAFNFEWYGMGQLKTEGFSHYKLDQIDLTGTSGIALHFLAQTRAIDILLAHPNADAKRLAVTGLSGGGWQTIFVSSLDPRVAIANPVAGYSSFVTRAQFPELDMGDSEQTPVDLASVADYTTLTAMLAPRPTLLTNNAYDNCCFRGDYANAPLTWAARPYFALYKAVDDLKHHISFEAGHNYGQSNREAFYRFVGEAFYPGDKHYQMEEIPSDSEVRTAEALQVKLPEDNLDFHQIAVRLSRNLPGKPDQPLAEVVRARKYSVRTIDAGQSETGGLNVRSWRFRMDNDWTVPVTEIFRHRAGKPVILIGDEGRAALAKEAEKLVSEGRRVIAVDPFYFGESRIEKRDFLFALLISSVGDRPIGIQASQIGAIARWVNEPVTIEAFGPRSSLIARVAAELGQSPIAGVNAHGALSSLKQVIDSDMSVDKVPELFCFGLLEALR